MSRNADQKTFWSDQAGPKWVAQQQEMDANMQAVLDGVFARAGLSAGQNVLDIGSGTGASSLQAADIVGADGHVNGADISETMLGLARTRAAGRSNVTMVLADAAEHPFAAHSYDAVISRFGVMFFADSVAAFRNIAKAMKPGARLTFAAWGQIPENPYFTLPARIAKDILGPTPKPDPDGPGPFAFRDPDRVLTILREAGFEAPTCDTASVPLELPGTAAHMAQVMGRIGPLDAAFTHFDATQSQRDTVLAAMTEALQDYENAGTVSIPAQINFVTAHA